MKIPAHHTEASIEFLKKWSPEGPWVLTSIIPDGKTDTVTFTPATVAKAIEWIENNQGKNNIYFHVNPVSRALSIKASKEDIERLAWLHVDLDPRAGEDFELERHRILKILNNANPKPSVIIDSGGGYQGFWRLEYNEKLFVGKSVTKAQELECYNIQLEKLFKADHCHNIDRIMRLPGTINVPTAKKVKKGRVPALSSVVFWSEVVYPIESFTPAVRVQPAEIGMGRGRAKTKVAGNVPVVGVEELRDWASENNKSISDHCLALIATGQDPIDPTKYSSRSEVLFKVCCDLVRSKVPDDMIFAVITGPNEISASVRDKPNWEAYALRQIDRAHEEAIDPWLRQLNEKHAVISDIGGKCRIISEIWDEAMKRTRISKQSFEDFRNRYRHLKTVIGHDKEGKPLYKPVGAFWIDHAERRQYDSIVFSPGREVEGAYNLWQGFACDSLPGDKHEGFLKHVLVNLCKNDVANYNYLVNWMARLVQQPDSPGEVAVVLRGKRGTGKSFFAKVLGSLFGRHYLQVSDSKHLVGSFNEHLRDTVLLFGDEAFFAGDKRHEAQLKALVTEEYLVVEGKGVNAEAALNFVHLILASNEDWVVPAGSDERRYLVLEVGDGSIQDFSYFKRLKEQLDNGGRENLLHYLLQHDISDYEVRMVPQTLALRDQKILTMAPEVQWFYERLWEGRLTKADECWKGRALKDTLYDEYIDELKDQGRNFRLSKTGFGKFLHRAVENLTVRQEQASIPWISEHGFEVLIKKRTYVYYFPPLDEIRDFWDKNFGGPFDWPAYVSAPELDQGVLDQLTEDDAPPF